MASTYVRNMIDAGIHFGHRTSRWNPKMGPYIFGKRNLIHIIDIRETIKGILRAKKFLSVSVAKGEDVLFVGTKRQARNAVIQAAERTGMHYVSERWLGGILTNFRTIRSRLSRLEELEAIEADGMAEKYSKKMIATLSRERRKIHRNLEGIRRMNKLPGAVVIIDLQREVIAAREARKLKIPVIALIDTDSDPDYVDIPIPGNDDAMRAIELVLEELVGSILESKRSRPAGDGSSDGDRSPRTPRRSSRVTAKAATGEISGSEQTASDQSDSSPAENTPTGSTVASS